MFRKLTLAALVAVAPVMASAAAIITDGNASLGVNDLGQLNLGGGVADVIGQTEVGVRWIDAAGVQYESTSHGCACEGWGLTVDGVSGFANNSTGIAGLTSISFDSTATTAKSVVGISGTDVTVTHDFQLSKSSNLYEAIVTVANTGASTADGLKYRRVMDWDTSPTPFNEYVSIGGTATTSLLEYSSADGFATADPFIMPGNLTGCGVTTDFAACGPSDHGSVFDFVLDALDAGESYSFSIFYGGAANLTEANAALGTVGAELFSYGWSGNDANQDGFDDNDPLRATPTFIFAFKGVGGTVIIPDPMSPVPLPAAAWMLLAGLAGLAGLRSRKGA